MTFRRLRSAVAAAALLAAGVGAVAPPAAALQVQAAATRPNVIVFLVDDLGWRDVGFMGSTLYQTPNIDRLAASGVRFTSAYAASPVCSPTRAALQTGRDPARMGITDWIPGYVPSAPTRLITPPVADRLPLAETTLGEAFKAAGYRTYHVGKWHLGPTPDAWPEAHGYDENIGGIDTGGPPGGTPGAYFSPYDNPRLPDGPDGEFLTDRLAAETAAIVARRSDQPFLIVHNFYQVHSPIEAAPAFIQASRAAVEALPDQAADRVELVPGSSDRARQDNPDYASMVAAMDAAVGRVLAAVEAHGLTDRTIVVFTSDNGGWSWVTPRGTSATSNLPLRGGKGWLYEGGVRVPWIIRAPAQAEPGETSTPALTTDLMPTLVDLAGIERPQVAFDGMSLAPALTGQAVASRDLHWFYPHYHNFASTPHDAIRSGDLKLIEFFEDDRVELYDLAADPGETRNLAADRPAEVARLRTALADWRRHIGLRPPALRETAP